MSAKRGRTRSARFIPLLLGTILVTYLGWRFLRPALGGPAIPERSASRTNRFPQGTEQAPRPEGRAGGTLEAASSLEGLLVPVAGVDARALHSNFSEGRGSNRSHEALDILAPRGTPVLAAADGVVRKLFTSVPGGLTVYAFDLEERYCFYYAHLDSYAPGLHEGQRLHKGDLVGTVGTTGNASKETPHLHFAVTRLDSDKKWWTGTPIDPYPLLVRTP